MPKREIDLEVNGQQFRILPLDASDGAYILKLCLYTEVALNNERDPQYKGPKGRVMTRAEEREVQSILLPLCMRVIRVKNIDTLEPVVTGDNEIVGDISHDTIYSLVEKVKKALIFDPLPAAKSGKLPA